MHLNVPSLEHIAAVKIVADIWNRDDVRALVEQRRFFSPSPDFVEPDYMEIFEYWNHVESKVKELVPKLLLHKTLKDKVSSFVKPIGLELYKWKIFHEQKLPYINLPNEFCWTPWGAIDKKKTAQNMTKNRNLALPIRCSIASFYCLEAEVVEMWNELSNELKMSLQYTYPVNSKSYCTSMLLRFWASCINGLENRGLFRELISFALHSGHQAIIEFVMQKFTSSERNDLLRDICTGKTLHTVYPCLDSNKMYMAEVIHFLLSQVENEQQLELLRIHIDYLPCYFLNWPWQDFFVQITNRVSSFFSFDFCKIAIHTIVRKLRNGYEDYNYRALFADLWKQIPDAIKRHIIHTCVSDNLLSNLFIVQSKGNIRLILEDATLKEREEIISQYEMRCREMNVSELPFIHWNVYADYNAKMHAEELLFLKELNREQNSVEGDSNV